MIEKLKWLRKPYWIVKIIEVYQKQKGTQKKPLEVVHI